MDNFKILWAEVGIERAEAYVGIEEYTRPASLSGSSEIAMSCSCDSYDEFEREVDRLINDLTKLKSKAKTQFAHRRN